MNVTITSPSGAQKVSFGNSDCFAVIAGPCVVEGEQMLYEVAEELKRIETVLPVSFVFKSSYRKANRTSLSSFTGLGDDLALGLLERVKRDFDFPMLTDVHNAEEAEMAGSVCDVLQIPAFLARQTELLVAAAKTGKVINIKKGQFMAPQDMGFARQKVVDSGNDRVLLCERGTFFGYGDLVVDFRSIIAMREFNSPIIYDATHSVQRPSQEGVSGGNREYILPLARAAVAVGIDGLFVETHPNPELALSDKASQLPLANLEAVLEELLEIRSTRRNAELYK